MTTKECYEKIGSNYESILGRFGSEALVKRFALKFLKDPSYAELSEALEARDAERPAPGSPGRIRSSASWCSNW